MFEALVAVGGTAAALIVLFLVRLRHRSNGALPVEEDASVTLQDQLEKLQDSPIFSGVAVEPHCRAASGLAGKKFPFARVPPLPVPGCDARTCVCRYIGLPERRRVKERRHHVDRRAALRMETNRRSGRARRASDEVVWTDQYNL